MHSAFGLSVPLYMVTYEKFVDTISYKPLVEISQVLQVKCSWGKDELLRF